MVFVWNKALKKLPTHFKTWCYFFILYLFANLNLLRF